MIAPAMVAEFSDVAGWTAEAVERLGSDHAIPAACRGTSSPAALAWLAEACELSAGDTLLDVGAGAGGPAAWARDRFGVRPVLVEPMLTACQAAAQLFELPVVAAEGSRIPLRTASADAAWCLGVLCTVEDKAAILREIHRVLSPGGSLGLMVVVAADGRLPGGPEGNCFPTQRELNGLLGAARFQVVEQIPCPGRAPLSWSRRVDRVSSFVAGRYATTTAFALAVRQGVQLTRLFTAGHVSMQLIHAVRRPADQRCASDYHEGEMTMASKRNRFLPRLKSEVEAEVRMVQGSYLPEADLESPATWMYDPVDVQREWVGLHTLLDAVDITDSLPPVDYTPEGE